MDKQYVCIGLGEKFTVDMHTQIKRNIDLMLKFKGMDKVELSKRAGTNCSVIYKMYKTTCDDGFTVLWLPKFDILKRLATAMMVRWGWLLYNRRERIRNYETIWLK